MADTIDFDTMPDDAFDYTKIPEIVTPDEMNESGYQEGSEQSYGERRDSKEGFGGEGDSDSGVDGISSGCSTVDDCPVVSINDVVAYYDEIRPRRRHVPQLSFYNVDIERMALEAIAQVSVFYTHSMLLTRSQQSALSVVNLIVLIIPLCLRPHYWNTLKIQNLEMLFL